MIKKIFSSLMIIMILLTAITPQALATSTADEYVPIEITREGTSIKINHETDYNITHAVVEYAKVENGVNVSRLADFDVKNNIFTIDEDVYALKVHQIKVLQDRVYYIMMTEGNNFLGTLEGVERQNHTQIFTTSHSWVLLYFTTQMGASRYIHEFTFDFEEEHDEILALDVHYVMVSKGIFATETEHNYKVSAGEKTYNYVKKEDVQLLEHLSGKSYAVRVGEGNSYDDGDLKNFAIINVYFTINGEHKLYKVINPPHTPDKQTPEAIDWFVEMIQKLQSFFGNIIAWWQNNTSNILKVLIVIGVLLAWAILSPVFKLLFFVIKMIFKAITSVLSKIFGVFF